MKLSIQKHVFELLKYHDCVVIAGLGGFILNPRPAYINQITNKIYPPSKRVSFNKNLSNNDGLLANYIANSQNISYDEACLEILKFTRKVKLKLKKGETILFENIGELHQNESDNIEFTVNTLFNFNTNSYGLSSFQIDEVKLKTNHSIKKMMSAAAVIILLLSVSILSLLQNSTDNMMVFNLSPINNSHYSPRETPILKDSLGKETPGIYNVHVSQVDFDLYKINGTNYHIATKKCFKLGFGRDVQIKIWRDHKDRIQRQVCFLNMSETEYDDCYKITNVYNEMTSQAEKVMVLTKRGKMKEAILVLEETYIDPYVIANSTPEDEKNEDIEDSLSKKNIGDRFIDAVQSLGTPTENKQHVNTNTIDLQNVTTPNETSASTKNVYIIVGSFSDKKNAKALSKQLNNRGFSNAGIIGENENGLIRVAVDSFYTEEEAHLVLNNIKKQLSSAWVLNNNTQ